MKKFGLIKEVKQGAHKRIEIKAPVRKFFEREKGGRLTGEYRVLVPEDRDIIILVPYTTKGETP
jgi:hypothetical protein